MSLGDDKLSFFLTNARSLLPKVEDLEATMGLNSVSLAFITETWLNDNIDDAAIHIPTYTVIRRDRVSRIGGGVCAFVKNHIHFKVLTELHEDEFETLWLHIRPRKLFRGFSCLIVCVAHNPPSCDSKAFIEHLITKLDLALAIYPNAGIFIVGDFNKCPISSLLRHFSLKQIVKNPTRNDVILDLILTNMSDFCPQVNVIAPLGRSDHNSVLFTLEKTNCQNQCNKVTIRRGNARAKRDFNEWLTRINWLDLYRTKSCEMKLNIFYSVVESGLDYFLPKKTVKIHASDKPWITPNYKNLIAKRQKAFCQGNRPLYRKLRNQCIRESKRLKSTFPNNKLNELKDNKNSKK